MGRETESATLDLRAAMAPERQQCTNNQPGPLVLWVLRLLCDSGATARHDIYGGQWRGMAKAAE